MLPNTNMLVDSIKSYIPHGTNIFLLIIVSILFAIVVYITMTYCGNKYNEKVLKEEKLEKEKQKDGALIEKDSD